MGMLAAFAGGAAGGVQSHWDDIKEQVAADAKRAFEERMVQVRADAQVNTAKQQQKNAFAFEQETLPQRLDMAEQTAIRTAEAENSLANRFAPDANAREAEALRSRLNVEQEYATGPEWQNLLDANGNVVGQQNAKTGKIQYFPGYKTGGGSGSGSGSGFKTNLEPLSMGDDMDYPNVWVDTKTGIVVDPQGQLTKPAADPAIIQAEVDKEIEDRKGGVMGFFKKDDREAFGGMTEDQFRQAEIQRRMNEAPTLADELGFGKNKVVRSEEELAARYQQMGIPVPGGYMTQADNQATGNQQSSGLVFDQSDLMVEDGAPVDSQNNSRTPGENSVLAPGNSSQPESQQPQAPKPVELSDEERSALAEFGIEVEQPKLNQPMRNPYEGSDVTGTVKNFFTDNAPTTTKLLSRAAQIPGNINEASMNAVSGVIDAVAQKHRDMVASGERMKASDKKRLTERLTEAFFNGEPSVDAAKMVLENSSATARQKTAAKAYLKLKGQM